MDKKGFTLIELLITVAIIGILAMIAIPAFVGSQKRAARSEAYANLQNLRLLEERFNAESGQYAGPYPTTSSIISSLSGFNPGSSLNYDYSITTSVVSSVNVCFTATAAGKSGTKVAGDSFYIDCSNSRNF